MASWAAFKRSAPEIAGAGARIWRQLDLGYLATSGADGEPRVHPVVVVIAGGELAVAVGMESPKFRDLQRDGRYALHTALAPDDEEFFLRGRVVPSNDAARRVRFAADAPYTLQEDEFVFDFDIEIALWTTWHHPGQPDTRPIRQRWRAED